VNQDVKPEPKIRPRPYDANYGNFHTQLYEEIRQEAFGEDIGQNSWLTASELDQFQEWLRLSAGKKLLDVACGAGGPALRIARRTSCSVVGIDLHEQAIAAANTRAAESGLAQQAEFRVLSAEQKLPICRAFLRRCHVYRCHQSFPCATPGYGGMAASAEAGRPSVVYRPHHRERAAD